MTMRLSTACFVALLLVSTASYAQSEQQSRNNLLSPMRLTPILTSEWNDVQPSDAQHSDAIHISILNGQGATNDSRRGTATQPKIQVSYADDTPVAGASVTVTAPSLGPSITFANGPRFATLTTDQFGRATLIGLTPVGIGEFQLTVVASFNGLTATAYISQTNRDDMPVVSGGSHARTMSARSISIIIGVLAAASLATALFLVHGGATSSSSLTATIGVGSPVTVGVPH